MRKHNTGAHRKRKVRERALREEQQARRVEMQEMVRAEERMVHAARRRQHETNPQTPLISTILAIMDQAHLSLVRETARRGLLTEDDIGHYDGA